MAIVNALVFRPLASDTPHLEAKCTYTVITTQGGGKFLQIDTYGSSHRKLKGKKSQSIRFTSRAVDQLQTVLHEHFSSKLPSP
jgi:hypothetical protein